MKDYKKSKGYLGLIVMLAIVAGIGFGVWSVFGSQISIDEVAVKEDFDKDTSYKYFYEQLDEQGQETYQRIYYALINCLEVVPLNEEKIEDIQDIYTYVSYDHPELYYVSSQYQYRKSFDTIELYPQYDYTKAEIDKYNQQIEDITNIVIEEAKKESTKAKQARYVYEYIIESVEYQENRKTDQNMISSLLEKKSVCAGYARAYQYLLDQLGIESAYIIGEANETNQQTSRGDLHAWVMVHIDGDYYYCDPTWGDIAEESVAHECHGYFMMSSDDMLACYTPQGPYEKTSGNKNYYFDEVGTYLTSYDEKAISNAVRVGLDNGSRVAEIKCANDNIYDQVKTALQSSYLGYRVLNQNGCWSDQSSYLCIDHLKLIEIYY